MSTLSRLYYTLRPLRWQQWWYRFWHPVAKRLARPLRKPPAPAALAGWSGKQVQSWTSRAQYDPAGRSFVFLNRKVRFGERIDWWHAAEGPLWQFNLQYFEWLYDDGLSVADRLRTVADFCRDTTPGRRMHAYPASLRIMAWIWFDARHRALDTAHRSRLYADADWLRRFPEYQLDGNHLFENGIALYTAGLYFSDERLLRSGTRTLRDCIRRQLLADGGHCEGAPMYHSLLLWRVLQCLDLATVLEAEAEMLELLHESAGRMLGWLKAITFSDGTWPAVNDSVAGIAPTPQDLMAAAAALGVRVPEVILCESGYRMIRSRRFELFVDVGGIQPAWQPGHAHADTGSFCLHVDGRPVIVDSGCSTYENAALRAQERGTPAHNTLWVDGKDSSELWSRFRVGKRCHVQEVVEAPDSLMLTYLDSGGAINCRTFCWTGESVRISDLASGRMGSRQSALHFHPDQQVTESGIAHVIRLEYEGIEQASLQPGTMAAGFNILLPSACLLLSVVSKVSGVKIGIESPKPG